MSTATDRPPLPSLQRHLAYAAVGPTTLRKMFERNGCRKDICDYLANVSLADLDRFGVAESLDRWTAGLVESTNFWGPSRKALNLFLRDAAYNHWMRAAYGLADIEHELELPLDSLVMKALCTHDATLPKPPPVKHLTLVDSKRYQSVADRIAKGRDIARVHLDLAFWNGGITAAAML